MADRPQNVGAALVRTHPRTVEAPPDLAWGTRFPPGMTPNGVALRRTRGLGTGGANRLAPPPSSALIKLCDRRHKPVRRREPGAGPPESGAGGWRPGSLHRPPASPVATASARVQLVEP